MASTPVAFRLIDAKEVDDDFVFSPSTRVARLCFRCDTRPPGEIFHGGFTNREFERYVTQAIESTQKQVWREMGKLVVPIPNPIAGKPKEEWKKPLLHPFAPGTRAAEIYEPLLAEIRANQSPEYRNLREPKPPHGPMYDITPSTGVAVTYLPQFAPLFPIGRGHEFDEHAWVYAVWVEDAFETFRRQEVDRPEIAGVQEIVTQFVPFHHVLAAVPCRRFQFDNHAIYPMAFMMGLLIERSPHANPMKIHDAEAALRPLLGRRLTIVGDHLGWRALPLPPPLPKKLTSGPPSEPPPPPPTDLY